MIYTITFNPALDYIIKTQNFEIGKINRSEKEHILAGGKGINVSIVLKELGIETTALGFIAGFVGDEIERKVKEYGIKTDFIKIENDISRINIKIAEPNKETAINTLLSEFSLVLFDCDTEKDQEYFEIAQEIYLVQSLDVLTIQPLTTFLKKLKMNKLLNEEKLRILINKDLRVNELNERKLISAMSVYNSPDTTYQLDLFNRYKIGYLTIPFEEKNYSKYLDELADCKLTIRGYSKNLISSFNKLAKFVYPINGKKRK